MAKSSPVANSLIQSVILILAAALCAGLIAWRSWWRLNRAVSRPAFLSPEFAIVMYFLLVVMAMVGRGLAMIVWSIPGPQTPDEIRALSINEYAKLTLGVYAAQSIVIASGLIAWRLRRGAAPSDHSTMRPSIGRSALIGLAAIALTLPIILSLGEAGLWIASRIRGEPVDAVAHDTLRLFIESPVNGWYVGLAAMIVVITPMLEEFTYRGLIQGTLVRVGMSRWPAILVTSAFFALMHAAVLAPFALPVLLVLSIAFGWAYERTGRLVAPFVMHMIFNAANLSMALLTHSP